MRSTPGAVTVTAKKLLEEAVAKSGRRTSVQLPEGFARIQVAGQVATSLSMLYGLGEVPLKLYLTLLMLTRKPPHDLYRVVPDHYWSELLGYEELNDADPIPGNGTRRVRRGMATLARPNPDGEAWITRTLVRGYGYQIVVAHPPELVRAPWISLPLELWSRGWINIMTGRAIFVYACLKLILAGKDDGFGVHVSRWDRKLFAVKDDTWQRGIVELESLGLVTTELDNVATDRWSSDLRMRKVYYLNSAFLVATDSPLKPV